jgi:hypothetical protein
MQYGFEHAPLFIAVPNALHKDGDFRLRGGSPAIDAGVDTGLPSSNNTRKDLGAFEFGRLPWPASLQEDTACK